MPLLQVQETVFRLDSIEIVLKGLPSMGGVVQEWVQLSQKTFIFVYAELSGQEMEHDSEQHSIYDGRWYCQSYSISFSFSVSTVIIMKKK